MNNPATILLLIIISSTLIFSCSNDNINSNLQGNWEVVKAKRNGRNTSTLEDAYFKFWNDDSLETNFLGETERTTYIIKKKSIVPSSELPELIVNKLINDTLIIDIKIQKYIFSLTLQNKK